MATYKTKYGLKNSYFRYRIKYVKLIFVLRMLGNSE